MTITSECHHLLADLDSEWAAIRSQHDSIVSSWSLSHPALAGVNDLGGIVARCRGGDDEATAALINLAQRPDPVAGHCLLQILLPSLVRLSGRHRGADLGSYVGACWLVISSWPARRRHHLVTALAWQTRRVVVRELRQTPLLAPALPDPRDHPALHDREEPPEFAARAVIHAAREQELVPAESLRALEAVYAAGLSGREAAEQLGMSHDMVRYRCSSAVRMLRRHREHLADLLTA